MKRLLITFSGAAYDKTTEKIIKRAPDFGVDEVRVYDDVWLKRTDFYHQNQWLWLHRGPGNEGRGRGFGWFSWKPFLIQCAMRDYMSDGDIVLYVDADTYPIADLGVLYDICEDHLGSMVFMATGKDRALRNGDWNKRDCLIAMGQDTKRYRDAGCAVARFILLEKGRWRINQFLQEWLAYCVNRHCQTFDPSVLAPEHRGFREHRTEQAIFTNLVHKNGWRLHREACEFGADCPQDWDLYPQLFSQKSTRVAQSLDGSKWRNV
ncbi:MAG: DUF1249 domain-containing protein [bacterium]|nr:DUF1249 domain-containing protein [bacterium]